MTRWFAYQKLGILVGAAALIAGSVASFNAVKQWLLARRIDAAVSVVSAELRSARHQAILRNCYVAALMPTTQDGNRGGVRDQRYKARAIRLCILAEKPEFDYANQRYRAVFASYVSDTDWSFLPDTFYIGYTASFGEYDEDGSKSRCHTVDGIPFPAGTSAQTVDNMRAFIFKPTGDALATPQTIAQGLENTEILIHAGMLNSTNDLLRLDDNSNAAIIRINHLSGKSEHE